MEENTRNTAYKELKGFGQVAYSIGHIGPGMLSQFITTWLLVYLSGNADNIILTAALVGTCTLAGEIVDALADPLVANWSDNFKHLRFGRRLPFMILGTIPMVITFMMVWMTGDVATSNVGRFIWLFIALTGFNFFYTVVVNPYFALLSEIAKDRKQLVFIQSFVSLFGIVGMGLSMAASGFLIDMFNDNYLLAGLVLSIFCIVVMLIPCAVIKPTKNYVYTDTERQTKNVFKNIVGAFENKKFRNYIIGFAMFFFGFQLIQYNMAFITTVELGLDKGISGTLFIVSVVSALALIPVYNIFVRKLGTVNSLRIAMFSYAVVAVLIAVLPYLNIGNKLILGYILMALLGFPYSGLMVIPNVLCSEIIDDDHKRFHVRREAMFFGVQGLVNKLAGALASFVVGLLLDYLGNTIENPLGVILVSPLAAVFALAGYFVATYMNKHAFEEPIPDEEF